MNIVHDTPQHNGVAERLNRTLLEKVRAMLHESGLPRALWGEAVRHAVWLKNRTPTKALEGGTPLEAATGQKPDLSRVRTWGSRVWVRTEGGTKLGGRVVEGRWVGIDDNSPNGCRVYWPNAMLTPPAPVAVTNANPLLSPVAPEPIAPDHPIPPSLPADPPKSQYTKYTKRSPAPHYSRRRSRSHHA